MSVQLKEIITISALRTKSAILWTSLFNEFLFSIYGLLAFILRKDLGATAFQIALLAMLKPVVSLFSSYWSERVAGRKHLLKPSIFWAGILARVPFLLFPFMDNVWFFIISAALHMLFSRAGTPAWMEVLKITLPKREREKFFSLGSAIGYGEGVLIAIAFGFLLDHYSFLWKWLFFLSAFLGIIGVFIQNRIPLAEEELPPKKENKESNPFLMAPWVAAWNLMQQRKDFARFQWGYMACGFGLMLIHPALPLFFVDVLHLSYSDLAIAFSIAKGMGFVFSSSLWARAMSKVHVSKLSGMVFLGVALFPLFLFLAPFHLFWLYLAYFVYGVAQAGSHLIWNLSGPIFARSEDSSLFTHVNILTVGVRGLIAPPIGSALCVCFGPVFVLFASMFLCVYASRILLSRKSFLKQKVADAPN